MKGLACSLECGGAGFKASDVHSRWEEGTESKPVPFESMPR